MYIEGPSAIKATAIVVVLATAGLARLGLVFLLGPLVSGFGRILPWPEA